MLTGTLSRYFGWRFLKFVLATFVGIVALAAMIDFIELMRFTGNSPKATPWLVAQISLLRVPQIAERVMPFSVLIGAMSCYLTLSRRLELVVARAAGISAWQFVAPAMIAAFLFGVVATTVYNPIAAVLHERSKRLDAEMQGEAPTSALQANSAGFWVRQRSAGGAAIINAKSSRNQGAELGGVSVYTFDNSGHFHERLEAKTATLEEGFWRLDEVRIYENSGPPASQDTYRLSTNLTHAQVRESFATPETVPFWQLPSYIELADRAGLAAAGYRVQYQLLLSQPFLLTGMVLLAASVSLRFFRFGGVQKMVLSGITAGLLLFVLSKFTEDMGRSELLPPVLVAWIPVLVGGLSGFVVLLYQEDG
ncbi:MAG TPA: LPS export ABC transporter permease LptG [Xanthobacteraceae bacterium]|nr:LPS export ABC transporter permease LptG [Xanthobacteraceae bacterium]